MISAVPSAASMQPASCVNQGPTHEQAPAGERRHATAGRRPLPAITSVAQVGMRWSARPPGASERPATPRTVPPSVSRRPCSAPCSRSRQIRTYLLNLLVALLGLLGRDAGRRLLGIDLRVGHALQRGRARRKAAAEERFGAPRSLSSARGVAPPAATQCFFRSSAPPRPTAQPSTAVRALQSVSSTAKSVYAPLGCLRRAPPRAWGGGSALRSGRIATACSVSGSAPFRDLCSIPRRLSLSIALSRLAELKETPILSRAWRIVRTASRTRASPCSTSCI